MSSELLFRSPPPTLLCHGVPETDGESPGPLASLFRAQGRAPNKGGRPRAPPRRGPGVRRRAAPSSRSNPGCIRTRRCASGGRRAAPCSPEAPGSASPTPSRSRCSALEAALGGAQATGLVDCIKTMHPTAIFRFAGKKWGVGRHIVPPPLQLPTLSVGGRENNPGE